MKTSELQGAELDYWVACAERHPEKTTHQYFMAFHGDSYQPSTNWKCCGPIIEREKIYLYPHDHGGPDWYGQIFLPRVGRKGKDGFGSWGPTPLIAAMRAYVASKFGDEVEDRKEEQS